MFIESETETKRRTFLHVLVLLEQVPGGVDIVGKTYGGKVFLSSFHLARKLQRSATSSTTTTATTTLLYTLCLKKTGRC